MEKRKIQLIAGTTYSISLPKEWIKKNKLKEKNEIAISEKNDGTLTLSHSAIKEKNFHEISLDVDEYPDSIDQILFALYYLGIENINLFSKRELKKDVKARIRNTLVHMSGTEISYEDKQKIALKVLLDKSKVSLIQILYRICLIIDSSIENLLGDYDLKEIRINENEIDRLYHLTTKIISLSLIDSNVLSTSQIKNITLIPSYFLISKKLENIGDNIKSLAVHIDKNKVRFEKEESLIFIRKEIDRSIKHILKDFPSMFKKAEKEEIEKIKDKIYKIKDKISSDYLKETLRYLEDIEEEIINISFYKKLISENVI